MRGDVANEICKPTGSPDAQYVPEAGTQAFSAYHTPNVEEGLEAASITLLTLPSAQGSCRTDRDA